MFNRKEIKTRAKQTFKTNYWYSVLVSFVSFVLAGGFSSSAFKSSKDELESQGIELTNLNNEELKIVVYIVLAIMGIILVSSIIGSLVKIFVLNPYSVGCKTFFVKNHNEVKPTFKETISIFTNGYYLNSVKTIFMKDLFITLWSFLFIIPGIIKAFEYSQTSYILMENPDMNYRDVLRLSKEMTNGYKWKMFILDLSFIGWVILALIPLVGPLYVSPYIDQTDAEVYLQLKENLNQNKEWL